MKEFEDITNIKDLRVYLNSIMGWEKATIKKITNNKMELIGKIKGKGRDIPCWTGTDINSYEIRYRGALVGTFDLDLKNKLAHVENFKDLTIG